jgi:uncharacterized protein
MPSTLRDSQMQRLLPMIDDRVLHLIVMPTERCNFRCTYCPQSFLHGKMTDSVVGSVKHLIQRRAPELDVLQISWFGGEPLLAAGVVLEVSEHARQLAAAGQMRFEGSITTNAFLLSEELFPELVGAGVTQFNISLDGLGDVHDRSRHLAGGKPTFARIWRNLVSIRDSGEPARIVLELHMDADNRRSLVPFVEEVAQTFLGDERFFYALKPIERLGGPNDADLPVLDPGESRELAQQLVSILPPSARPEQDTSSGSCYAAHANSFVVRSDGRLGKCSLALEDDRNVIGRLRPDGSIAVDDARLRPWLRGLNTLDPAVLACPLAGLP